MGYQFRSIFNELYLTDLKKKTHRGQMGQVMRGFIMGGAAYGYESVPVGELSPDKKGRLRAQGYTLKIVPEEARIIKKVFGQFADGTPIHKIVKMMNEEKIPCRRKLRGGWNVSTLSKILKNEKYKGTYIWNRTTTIKDPMTGKKKQILRPESEWVLQEKPELKIVESALWEKAQKRFEETKRAHPVSKGFGRQKSYVESNPAYLLSGNMVCGACGGSIVLVSGKGSGYYGCHNAKRKTCDNKLLTSRKKLESFFMAALYEKVLKPDHLQMIYKKIAAEIQKQSAHIPEEIRLKKMELEKTETRIHRFVEFIASAKATASIATALEEAEGRAETLKTELGCLESCKKDVFEPPPREWLAHKIDNIQGVLEQKTEKSALLLRKLTGKITLTPKTPEVGRPYYHAKSRLKSFALLGQAEGSIWLKWRRRREFVKYYLKH